MAVRLVGLFERCGFENSVAGVFTLRNLMGMIPGMGWIFGEGLSNTSDTLGLWGRGWARRLLQETKLGQGFVEALWGVLDKAWETAEGIGEVNDGEVYKLRPGSG